MRRSRASAFVGGLALGSLVLNGCGLVGDVFGEREPVIHVRNDTTNSLYAGATDYADGDAARASDVPIAGWSGVTWGGCKTSWLVLRRGLSLTSEEFARHELTLCSGDKVTVGPDYEVTVECRERNQTVRSEPDC